MNNVIVDFVDMEIDNNVLVNWVDHRNALLREFGRIIELMKKAVEEAITMRYYLRSMGVKVSLPTTIYGDNLSAITNTIEPGSPLKKKYLALLYHFCREHFSAGVVSIRKIDGKHNYADPFTKALVSNEFHGLFNEIMMN